MSSQHDVKKLSQFNIERRWKPFVDENLQLHIPHSEFPPLEGYQSPIYAYYKAFFSSSHSVDSQETELSHAMEEAERAYQAWEKMQEKIKQAIDTYALVRKE